MAKIEVSKLDTCTLATSLNPIDTIICPVVQQNTPPPLEVLKYATTILEGNDNHNDEMIYKKSPTFLLGTIDKFAQFALKPQAKNLLADDEDCVSLIIQDELHLLTGPLGSMAGLLETALDTAWEISANHKPKYIAATATIRGAERDAKLMFGRNLHVFPPPINTATDNFFASESKDDRESSRLHLAVLGPPRKSRTLGDLPIASLLQSANELAEQYGEEITDPYWTFL